MTLRYFYQRCNKINLIFEILILVILLTTRTAHSEEEPTTEHDLEGQTEPSGLEEESSHLSGHNCNDLITAASKTASCKAVIEVVNLYKNAETACIIRPEDEEKLCAVFDYCPAVEDDIRMIFEHSVMPEELPHKKLTVFVKRHEALMCSGEVRNGAVGEGGVLDLLSLFFVMFVLVFW